MTRISLRLGKLEAALAPPVGGDRRFAVVQSSVAEAEDLPSRLDLVSDQEFEVLVTETGWDGGDPVVVSPLCSLNEMSDAALDFLETLFDPTTGQLAAGTVVVPCVVESGAST